MPSKYVSDEDTDSASQNFVNYRGNGRRITTVPVTDSVNGSRVVGYARFFLLTTSNYSQAQGNEPWCDEFIGIGAPEGGGYGRRKHGRGRNSSPAMELRKERGSSILEFAIGASLLVLLFTGIFQFGYTFYAYSKLRERCSSGGAVRRALGLPR